MSYLIDEFDDVAENAEENGAENGIDPDFIKPTRGRSKPNPKTKRTGKTNPLDQGSGKGRALAKKAAFIADAAEQLADSGVQLPQAFGGARAYVGKAPVVVDESATLPSYMRLDNE